MQELQYKRFRQRVLFNKWCTENLEGYTTYSRNQWCFKKDDKSYSAASVFGFAQNVNKVFGEILLPKNCRNINGSTTLCILTEPKEVVIEKPLISLEQAPVEAIKPVETTVEEVKVVETEVVETVEQPEPKAKLDMPRINAYKNNKLGKDDLETYGKTFGIDLKKNKSIDNMRADLIAFVEAQ